MRLLIAAVFGVFFSLTITGLAQVRPRGDSVALDLVDGYRYFDQPIDPTLYLIRPGDKLIVTFINAKLAPLTLVVDPEARIVDQTLGRFDLADRTLAQAKELLIRALRDLYQVEEITISVHEPAKVGIQVSGAVGSPGLYLGYTSQRVSEIIDSAGGVTSNGSRRWIEFCGGSRSVRVDLDRSDFLGDYSGNPCLYAGYSVLVPAKSDKTVQVVGEVNNPREIELVPGDSLAVLLQLAGGVRSHGDADAAVVISRHAASDQQPAKLLPGDIIMVPPKKHETARLVAFGAVNNPGTYDYRPGITLPELISQAGGFRPNANCGRCTLFRRAQVDEWARLTTVRYPIANIVANDGSLQNLPLQPHDSLFVPVRAGFVKVSGEVLNPGIFPFTEGGNAISYIRAAGGFLVTANSTLVDIFDRVSHVTSTHPPEVRVHDGDEVIARVREELK